MSDLIHKLRLAVSVAAKTFRRYEQVHRAKGTPEGNFKAAENAVLAEYMEEALNEDVPNVLTKDQADIIFKDEIHLLKTQGLAMPTTGNPEQDDAHLHDAARSTCMIAAGFCPNGCGELRQGPGNEGQVCLACNFSTNRRKGE